MRRIAHVGAPPELVRELFHDVGSWPGWMPGLTACRVLEKGDGRVRAEVSQSVLGRIWRQTVDIGLASDGARVKALDGLLRWTVRWGFRAPPDGVGTTLSLEVEADPGLMGRATRGTFHRVNDRRFDETVAVIVLRARRTAAPAAPAAGRRLLVVYETTGGYEVWYGGRTYAARKAGV